MGYTKLFNEIVMSTVWHEPHTTRILWITMLAIKDRWHLVNASIPGLASTAMITMEECESGLKTLSLPDPYSRTQDFDGRRIEKADGGWVILNGEKYRNKMTRDERNEYQRIKQREYRAKKKGKSVKSCLQNSQHFTHTEADTDTEADIKPLLKEITKEKPRDKGRTPRDFGVNPRALGVNPRALGTNPKVFEIPAEINPTAWSEFEQHRKEVKKPMTNLARKKNLAVLMKLTESQQVESVNQTIANRWTGLFPPKEVGQKITGYHKPKTSEELIGDGLRRSFGENFYENFGKEDS